MWMVFPRWDGPLDETQVAEAYRPAGGESLRTNMVTSVTGALELHGRCAGLTNPADQGLMGILRSWADAIVLGAGTWRAESYALSPATEQVRDVRRRRGLADDPTLVLVSGTLHLDPAALAAASPVRPIVVTTAAAGDRRVDLEKVAEVVTAGERDVDLVEAVRLMRARGLARLLCEGGPRLLAGLVEGDLVDELCLTLAPVATAGGQVTAFPGTTARPLTLAHQLVEPATGTTFFRYLRTR